MEQALEHFFSELHWGLLGLVIALSLGVLGKAADWLVDEAVALSEKSGIPKVVIGATVVSLGTTMPEAAVSVFAAIQEVRASRWATPSVRSSATPVSSSDSPA